MWLARMMIVRAAAALIGLDDMASEERSTALLSLVYRIQAGITLRWTRLAPEEVMADAMAARGEFECAYYSPSLERRRGLVAGHRAGDVTENLLPVDLITTMLLHTEAWDQGLALRETVGFLGGSIGTTANGVALTVAELGRWLDAHPEDDARIADLGFLRQAANESLRLHPPVPVLLRRALADVELRSGRSVSAGELVAIRVEDVNRDGEIFGPEAATFNPHRRPPTRYPGYGLAFGAGRHLCVGKPIVTSAASAANDVVERTMVPMLRSLLKAGVRRDPALEPTPVPSSQNMFEAYPVLFTAL
jgi:cytochrome P450